MQFIQSTDQAATLWDNITTLRLSCSIHSQGFMSSLWKIEVLSIFYTVSPKFSDQTLNLMYKSKCQTLNTKYILNKSTVEILVEYFFLLFFLQVDSHGYLYLLVISSILIETGTVSVSSLKKNISSLKPESFIRKVLLWSNLPITSLSRWFELNFHSPTQRVRVWPYYS